MPKFRRNRYTRMYGHFDCTNCHHSWGSAHVYCERGTDIPEFGQECRKCHTMCEPDDVEELDLVCQECGENPCASYCNREPSGDGHRSDLCGKCKEGFPCFGDQDDDWPGTTAAATTTTTTAEEPATSAETPAVTASVKDELNDVESATRSTDAQNASINMPTNNNAEECKECHTIKCEPSEAEQPVSLECGENPCVGYCGRDESGEGHRSDLCGKYQKGFLCYEEQGDNKNESLRTTTAEKPATSAATPIVTASDTDEPNVSVSTEEQTVSVNRPTHNNAEPIMDTDPASVTD